MCLIYHTVCGIVLFCIELKNLILQM